MLMAKTKIYIDDSELAPGQLRVAASHFTTDIADATYFILRVFDFPTNLPIFIVERNESGDDDNRLWLVMIETELFWMMEETLKNKTSLISAAKPIKKRKSKNSSCKLKQTVLQ